MDLLEQIDGVSMGSLLGPYLANVFLSYHENTWLENCPRSFKPIYYRRYVDDCFLLFCSPEHINLFLNFLNQQHANIKFSSEIETPNKTLSFLDIQIKRNNSSFSTSVYQKLKFTGLFTNFHSFILLKYKKGLILTLTDRFFKICSTYENFHQEAEKFRTIFKLNGYPTHLWDKCVQIFLDNTFKPIPKTATVPKKIIYFCLPFTGLHSFLILTQSAFSHIDIRTVFRPTKRLSHFFPFQRQTSQGSEISCRLFFLVSML